MSLFSKYHCFTFFYILQEKKMFCCCWFIPLALSLSLTANVFDYIWISDHAVHKIKTRESWENLILIKYYIWIIFSAMIKAKMHPQSLNSLLSLPGSTFHSVILGSFYLYAVSVDDHIIFHLHMLTYEIGCFCGFWLSDSRLIQEMRYSTPEYITARMWKARKLCV